MAKCKLTDSAQKTICDFIRRGNRQEAAAGAAGIDRVTFWRWMKKGEEANSGIFRNFCNAVKKAEEEAETLYVERIATAAAQGNWTAAAWWLERKMPEAWGKRDKLHLEQTGKDGGPVEVKTTIEWRDDTSEVLGAVSTAPGAEEIP